MNEVIERFLIRRALWSPESTYGDGERAFQYTVRFCVVKNEAKTGPCDGTRRPNSKKIFKNTEISPRRMIMD